MPTPTRRRTWRIVGTIAGVVLLAAAVWAVVRQGPTMTEAARAAREAPWWLVACAVLLPLINVSATAGTFWVLTDKRFGRVGPGEMHALIGAAWLLNYLPMRPGMFGRFAYHKAVNGVKIKHSARVLLEVYVLTAVAVALLAGVAALLHVTGADGVIAAIGVMVPAALLGITAMMLRGTHRLIALACVCRWFDLAAWLARYACVFRIIGVDATLAELGLVTAVSQIALVVPLAGNGLGLREWGVGAVFRATGGSTPLGLAADLLNRAAELVVAIPLGLASAAWVAARHRKYAHRHALDEDAASENAQNGVVVVASGATSSDVPGAPPADAGGRADRAAAATRAGR